MDNLAKELLDISTQSCTPTPEVKNLLTQMTEAINSGEDTTSLIGPAMKLLPNHDLHIKKVVHGVLPRLCEKHPQAAVLAANSVQQDCADLNPAVKAVAVVSLASIPELSEHAPALLHALLADGHPRVRLAAVQACRAFDTHSSLAEHGLINAIYGAVRDSDPQVATCSLLTLDLVLADEGGVIVTRAMARHLLKRLASFPAPQLASVMQALAKYKPKNDSELFEELSYLDPYLTYTQCAAVTVNCIRLFVKLISQEFCNLLDPLVERSAGTLHQYLTGPESGALYVLEFLNSEIALPWLKITPFLKLIPLEADSDTMKSVKLKIIPKACTAERAAIILNAVTPLCHDAKCGVEAIGCVCKIREKCPETSSACLDVLLQLLSPSNKHCTATVRAMNYFNLEGASHAQLTQLLEQLVDCVDITQPHKLPSLLPRLVGLHGVLLPSASYLLEHMSNNVHELQSQTRRHLLRAMWRMFLREPAECQLAFGRLLWECVISPDTELSSLAFRYHRLLSHQEIQLGFDLLLPQEGLNSKLQDI